MMFVSTLISGNYLVVTSCDAVDLFQCLMVSLSILDTRMPAECTPSIHSVIDNKKAASAVFNVKNPGWGVVFNPML